MLFIVDGLQDGQTARCTRCGQFLTRYRSDSLERVLAFNVAALVALAVACSFPFMQFKSSGFENLMTLPQTALELYHNDMPVLSLLVAAFIILIPSAVLILQLILVSLMLRGRQSAWLPRVGRLMYSLETWSMVDVFLIGVIVSLVKIAHMATVVLGISFYAYAGFTILFVLAISNLDRFQCWRQIEALCETKEPTA